MFISGTHWIFKLLADGADNRKSLLQFGRQLIRVHVAQAQHVTHLQ